MKPLIRCCCVLVVVFSCTVRGHNDHHDLGTAAARDASGSDRRRLSGAATKFVCVSNGNGMNPRTASLFIRGTLARYGSRYTYYWNNASLGGCSRQLLNGHGSTNNNDFISLALVNPMMVRWASDHPKWPAVRDLCKNGELCVITGDELCQFPLDWPRFDSVILRQYVDLLALSNESPPSVCCVRVCSSAWVAVQPISLRGNVALLSRKSLWLTLLYLLLWRHSKGTRHPSTPTTPGCLLVRDTSSTGCRTRSACAATANSCSTSWGAFRLSSRTA